MFGFYDGLVVVVLIDMILYKIDYFRFVLEFEWIEYYLFK